MRLHGRITLRNEWSPHGMSTVQLTGDKEDIIAEIRRLLEGNWFNLSFNLWDEDRLAILRGESPNSEQLAFWD